MQGFVVALIVGGCLGVVLVGYSQIASARDYRSRVSVIANKTDIRRGAWVDPAAGKVTFREYAEAWRAAQVHRPGTASQIETNLRRHVYPRIGNRPLALIRPSDMPALAKAMATGDETHRPLAPSTIGIVYAWVATVFSAVVSDRSLVRTPCEGIRRPEVEKTRIEPLPSTLSRR